VFAADCFCLRRTILGTLGPVGGAARVGPAVASIDKIAVVVGGAKAGRDGRDGLCREGMTKQKLGSAACVMADAVVDGDSGSRDASEQQSWDSANVASYNHEHEVAHFREVRVGVRVEVRSGGRGGSYAVSSAPGCSPVTALHEQNRTVDVNLIRCVYCGDNHVQEFSDAGYSHWYSYCRWCNRG